MSQPMDITQLTLPVEYLLRPLTRQAETLGERAEQLYYLSDVVVIFAVFCAGLRIEEIVAGDELEDLYARTKSGMCRRHWGGVG